MTGTGSILLFFIRTRVGEILDETVLMDLATEAQV